MIALALTLLAQAAPAAVDTVAALSPEAIGGGAVGAVGLGGAMIGVAKWAAGAVLKRLDTLDARIVAIEAAQADLRADARVATERDRHLRELLTSIKATVERDR